MTKERKGDKEEDERSAVVVIFSLALSMVDLEESGVIFSETRSEKGLRRESDMLVVVSSCVLNSEGGDAGLALMCLSLFN
jgi:hypothetical protein